MAFSKARRLSDFIAADGTIPTGKFASGTITSAHIADTAITHADLHTDMNLTSKTVQVANASTGDSDTTAANTAFVQQEIAALVDSSPSALNTLNELAAALGDDANFSTTVTNSIATKLPLAGGTLTGALTIGSGGGLHLRPTDSSDTDAWILYQYTDDTLRYNFTGAGADEIIIKHPGSTNATTLTIDTANKRLGVGTTSPDHLLDILKTGTGDATVNIKSTTGGDPTLIFNSAAANRSGLIKYQDNGANVGRIQYVHNGDRIDFQAGSATGATMSVANSKVGISQSNPYFPLHVQGPTGFNGEAKNNILAFDTTSATTGTGGGIAFGGYTNGTGGDVYHLGNIQGIKENSTAGNTASAMIFSTRANGATPLEHMRINSTGNVIIGANNPSAATPLTVYYSNTSQFNIGGPQGGISNNVYYNGSAYVNRNTSAGGTLLQMGTDGSFAFRRGTSGSSPTLSYSMYVDANGGVGIGPTSITNGVKLEVHGGKIYVPNHGIQAQTAILQSNTTMNFAEQPANGNSYTSPAANKTMAVFGSNSSTCGIAIQRDMSTGFPDFAVMPGGTTYFNGNTTQVGAGASNASMYASEPGYVGVGRKIDSHEWKNWSGTGNYTARLYTPIVHTEGNMFQIEIDVFGYGTGGKAQRYIGGGYAYAGSTLIANATVALSGTLNHRLTTATHPTAGIGTVVVFDLGYTSNNGTAYYNHMRWRYVGWQQKNPADFVWAAITT